MLLSDDRPHRDPWWARWWFCLTEWARGPERTKTPLERSLLDERANLKLKEANDRDLALEMAQKIRELTAEVAVLKREVELLASVHERDRIRVQQDIAAYTAAIARNERLGIEPQQRRE